MTMMLQISLPPDTEAKLRERAAAEGKDPAVFALEAVQEKLADENGASRHANAADRIAAWDRFVAEMHAWTRTLPAGHHVDDSRDSIHERLSF